MFLQIARTLNEESVQRPFRALDPSVLLAALATHTHHIGLVSTVPAPYASPAPSGLTHCSPVTGRSRPRRRTRFRWPTLVGSGLGFNLNVDRYTDGLDHLVDWLVPGLQARGRFRAEYEGTTFRGTLASRTSQPDADPPA